MKQHHQTDRFHKRAIKSVHEQIREVALSGAVTYRVFVHCGQTVVVFPQKAVYGADSFNLVDFEYPATVPNGTHQILFLDANGKALKATRALTITIPPLGAEQATTKAADRENKYSNEKTARKAPADYIRQRQQLDLRRRRLEIAAEARFHGAQWEAYELMDATQRDALDRLRYTSTTATEFFETQIGVAKSMRAEIESIPKPPPPAPPPTDWGGVVKEGMEALKVLVNVLVVGRGDKPAPRRANESGRVSAADGKEHTAAQQPQRARVEQDQTERDRLGRESAERERLARERAERDRLELERLVAEQHRLEQQVAEMEAKRKARTEVPAPAATLSEPSPKSEDNRATSTTPQEGPTSPLENATTAGAVPPGVPPVKTSPATTPVTNPFAESWLRIKRLLAGMNEIEAVLFLSSPQLFMLFLAILRGMTPFAAARAGPGGLLPRAAAC